MSNDTIFISYADEDSVFALKLKNDLFNAGVKTWAYKSDIKPGQIWDDKVEEALNKAPKLIVILSKDSVNSKNVKDEINEALNNEITIIPIILNDCKIPLRLGRRLSIDFRAEYEGAFKKLLNCLRDFDPDKNNETDKLENDTSKIINSLSYALNEKQKKEEAAKEKKRKAKNKGLLIIGIVSVIVCISILFYFLNHEDAQTNVFSQNVLSKDSIQMENLIREGYDRLQKDIRASHIQVKLDSNASPEDTIIAYNRILKIRTFILDGHDFNQVAYDSSDDPRAKENNGDLGFMKVFEMFYPFETAIYTTPPGQISLPVRSEYGYHILKIMESRPALGIGTFEEEKEGLIKNIKRDTIRLVQNSINVTKIMSF
jgi:flagellar basal body-associated protein FliL